MTPTNHEPDNDPICVCGVHRSEHAMMGCPEGFQTPDQWEEEKQAILAMDEDTWERYSEYLNTHRYG